MLQVFAVQKESHRSSRSSVWCCRWLFTKPIPLVSAEPPTYMLLSVRKECSLATWISQMLLQRSFSSSITSAIVLRSSSRASFSTLSNIRSLFSLSTYLTAYSFLITICFLACSGTFHLSIPDSLIPRFKEDPLWSFPLLEHQASFVFHMIGT